MNAGTPTEAAGDVAMTEAGARVIAETLTEERARDLIASELARMRQELTKARVNARKRLDLDVRGLLALMSLVGGLSLAFTKLIATGDAEIPTWAAQMLMGVMGFYFGSKGGSSGNGH